MKVLKFLGLVALIVGVYMFLYEREIETKGLSSSHALLVEAQSGSVIMSKNSNKKLYPASMTKVMTALVAIELLDDLNEFVHLVPDLFHDLYIQNVAQAGFTEGDWCQILTYYMG